jgi:hypothetical protein
LGERDDGRGSKVYISLFVLIVSRQLVKMRYFWSCLPLIYLTLIIQSTILFPKSITLYAR